MQPVIERHDMFLFSAKMARMKQAKEEAETEISEHKTSTEHGFQRKLEEVRFLKTWFFLNILVSFEHLFLMTGT